MLNATMNQLVNGNIVHKVMNQLLLTISTKKDHLNMVQALHLVEEKNLQEMWIVASSEIQEKQVHDNKGDRSLLEIKGENRRTPHGSHLLHLHCCSTPKGL